MERPRRSPRGSFILGKAVSRRMSANSKEKVPFLFENWKVDKMELPAEVKPALWGVAGGAVAAIVIGFAWGGWVTGGTSESSRSRASRIRGRRGSDADMRRQF